LRHCAAAGEISCVLPYLQRGRCTGYHFDKAGNRREKRAETRSHVRPKEAPAIMRWPCRKPVAEQEWMGCLYVCHGFPGTARVIIAIARSIFLIQIILTAVLFHRRGNFLQIFWLTSKSCDCSVSYQGLTRIIRVVRNKPPRPAI
jgi:hypothetical protein